MTTHPQNFVTLRDARNQTLRIESGRIREDFPEMLRGEFDRLVSALTRLTNKQLVEGDEKRSHRDIWLETMEPVISFVEQN